MEFLKKVEVWFVVGTQHLYGNEALSQVKKNAEQIVQHLNSQNPFLQIKLKKYCHYIRRRIIYLSRC